MTTNRKPNELHKLEGTGRADRGTNVLLQIPESLATTPASNTLVTFDREGTFEMLLDWVINATGSAAVDTFLLNMMVNELETYV